ncbi:ABC transporter substrate-binding protein [Cellulosilyticum sp. I15G10I2]|uniref:ABC transporter substrate-binding protein n=1 Tax=Cellulosilyticum sp. I15G10I2 TaxID=1892843 RepID=UPI00085C9177|nr:sugar ABC transporter substrate-binding protein [Cellulosilyticum sp. I15G10I2]
MKFYKIIAPILSLTLLMATACSNNTASTSSDNSSSNASSGSGKVKLTFMGWEASPLETEAVKEGIAKFEAQNPNITIDYTPGLSGTEYTAKLMTMVAGNSAPDVFFIGSADYRTFVDKDALMNITDRFDSNFPVDDIIDSSKEIMTVNNNIYGISACTVSPIIYYNKDIFDKAGLPYPDADPTKAMTWEEFRTLAQKLTIKNGDSTEVYGAYGLETWLGRTLFYSNGGAVFNADYSKATMNDPKVAEVMTAIRDLRVVDGAAPDATTLENVGMSAAQMLQTGKVAMLIDGSWALQQLASMNFNVGMAPLPKFDKALTTGQAHLHAISATTKYPEEAWKFLTFLSGYDYQGALVSSGLWMPNRKSMYESDGVAKWYKEDVHGDSYKHMLSYFKDAIVEPTALQKSTKCGDIMTEESDKFFKDGQDINVTLENIDKRCNEELERVLGTK